MKFLKTQATTAMPPRPDWIPPRLLTPAEVAGITGVSVETLATWRSTKLQGPAYVKLGGRVAYPPDELWKWLHKRTVRSALVEC